jgi:3-dehydroquinate synthetase
VVSSVLVGEGLLHRGTVADVVVPTEIAPGRVAVLAQPGSHALAESVAEHLDARVRILPDRDAAKKLAVVEDVYLWLNDLGFTRGDLIVAVGGGALTDVAGFIAATYLRGVPVVLVPTTLLSAVDAAIGGKTGVNVGGKNLAGVFRHPARVVVDTDVLAALPEVLVREGAAEAVKAGFIGDPALVDLYEAHGLAAPVSEVVTRAIAVKARIVSEDFTERGVRAHLNYGHTVGHAVEVAAGISHGHAVAVGMVAAGAVSERRLGFGDAVRQTALLRQLGLPTEASNLDAAHIRALMALDKKRDASGLRMTLLHAVGAPVVVAVDDADVRTALRAVRIE